MITVRAPGKLFVAGEYAVVEPGQPAVIIAIDRYLAVTLTESVDVGTVHSPEYGQLPLVWRRSGDDVTIDRDHHPYDYVMSAITTVERVRARRSVAPKFFDTRIDSQLDDVSGRKFGIGSSAAVTVATVRAMSELYGLGLSNLEVFKLALLATVQIAPAASGGDLAASCFGGWIRYSAPDRARLIDELSHRDPADLLDADCWDGLSVTRLTPPDHLQLLVGWTGSPASTTRFVDVVQAKQATGEVDMPAFVAASRDHVDALVRGLQEHDDVAVLAAIHGARTLLQGLGAQAGLDLETSRLAALCDAADEAGAAGKPSGAGGGDCGIVLAPPSADVARMLVAWERDDVRHLTISVHPPEGAVDDE